MDKRRRLTLLLVLLTVTVLGLGATKAVTLARSARPSKAAMQQHIITKAQRFAAAEAAAAARKSPLNALANAVSGAVTHPPLNPNATPDYFGTTPYYANSQLPTLDATGNVVPGTGIRKFVDSLPGLGAANANDLGQFIPVAVPDTTTYPGSDYYVIALVRYTEKLGRDLPATTLQGYMQLTSAGATLTAPSYLGPAIVAQRNRPVRVKFINKLPTGSQGNLFLPVDTTLMGAGMGPQGGDYTQNRATIHLHGGATPWISDGTPHQWTVPAGQTTTYTEGVSVFNVPDMDSGHEPTGTLTFFYTNQQSARLMFYHDHSYGITRLNVYAGEAAPYILQDPVEQTLVNGGGIKANGTTVTVAASTIPTEQIPLVIQDKTFVPNVSQLTSEDPTWDVAKWGGAGSLWLPHVYMPNQTGSTVQGGVNGIGRWDYNPWFYPPVVGQTFGPVPNPLYNGGLNGEPPMNPGTPTLTVTPEAFMDTPLVNGTAYPYLKVGRKAYRFRILNASNDRTLNLQLYFAKSNTVDSVDASGNPTLQTASGEVSMTPAAPHPGNPAWPSTWPTDGRDGGVPDPSVVGPSMIQIGNEGGFLPSATVLPNTPVGYEYFRRTITVLNVKQHTLLLGPAERADVIIDFSQVPAGSKLIMYNDCPAPIPGFDSRYDYYTGDGDQTPIGGAPDTKPGYGPNTRTIMQFQVGSGAAAPAFSLSNLQTGLQAAYAASQDKPIVPESAYNSVYATSYPDNIVGGTDTQMHFTPAGASTPASFTLQEKAIIEGFDVDYGRMNAQLGGTLPNLGPQAGGATPYDYIDTATDGATNTIPGTQIGSLNDGTQIWRLDHQGVDTHSIHFHLFNVQVIERVAIDGQIFMPDASELGWKETIRMNPGTDTIIALRPVAPTLPFKIPDSIRPIDPALPLGATFTDSLGTVVTNTLQNFGWEYVWHCHLLEHEENDMMRPFTFMASPAAPTSLTATPGSGSVSLAWHDNSIVPLKATNFFVQRATNAAFTSGVATFAPTAATFVNTPVAGGTYYYRVRAENSVSYSTWSNAVTVSVAGGTGISVTINANPTSVALPRAFILSGVVTPAAPGGIVAVYVLRPGALRWSYSSNRGLNASSQWSYSYTPTLRGTYQFYALYGTTQSRIISVVVR